LVVLKREVGAHLGILADSSAPLRLIQSIDPKGRIRPEAIKRLIAVLRDFLAIAEAAGAGRPTAVATAAVRSASNSASLVQQIAEETGLEVEIIDGEREARCAFLGAVHSLPVERGMLIDLGGGSMQLMAFHDRSLRASWSLPLGALHLTNRFLTNDPPSDRQTRKLRRHVHAVLREADIPALGPDGQLVGTGGTIRNIAKIDRHKRSYPIRRPHGYLLGRRRVHDLSLLLASMPRARRRGLMELNAERSDSIVGGIIAVETVFEHLGADDLLLAGLGLREGVVYGALGLDPPGVEEVRRASILALTSRFSAWNASRAERRSSIAISLLKSLEPGVTEDLCETVRHAAVVLDIGRSIDYYQRHLLAARIVAATDLAGFSHRGIALLSATIHRAGDGKSDLLALRPLLRSKDARVVERCAIVLALADEIERRIPPGGEPKINLAIADGEVVLDAALPATWRPRKVLGRFRRAFGRRLVLLPEPV
jgi:exopolyphosphatase/guanosine-5'-triphosphate,3'-diphosphate pyrophosphatase